MWSHYACRRPDFADAAVFYGADYVRQASIKNLNNELSKASPNWVRILLSGVGLVGAVSVQGDINSQLCEPLKPLDLSESRNPGLQRAKRSRRIRRPNARRAFG